MREYFIRINESLLYRELEQCVEVRGDMMPESWASVEAPSEDFKNVFDQSSDDMIKVESLTMWERREKPNEMDHLSKLHLHRII